MATITLQEFIGTHRDQLIRRCRTRAANRSDPQAESNVNHGIPLFLDQLIIELGNGPSMTMDIMDAASRQGHDLMRQGFTLSEVVHSYGDVCQSVTELALELAAPVSTDDFRTLNRCLDDAIARAVTQHASEQELMRDGETNELRTLLDTALSAFEVLQTGNVGVVGRTGSVVLESLMRARDLVDRRPSDVDAEASRFVSAPDLA